MELDEQIRKLQEEKDRIYAEERKTALADIPGWYPAGSALHGVGVPECIAELPTGRRRGRLRRTLLRALLGGRTWKRDGGK
jgi:hypothetical protein